MINDEIIRKSLELGEVYRLINSDDAHDNGQYVYSINIGHGSRGTLVNIHVQDNKFYDIVKNHPCGSEYRRFEISEVGPGNYHVSYVLPAYESQVSIVTIVHSLVGVASLIGQDVFDHIFVSK